MLRSLLAAMLIAFAGGVAHAQDAYPSRPVKVIVPWPPGGSNDVAGRILMKAIAESTRQPFVIDNRAGAGGTIGAAAVAKAAPDGYTVMVHSGSHIANAFTYKDLPYQTLKDFIPVGTIAAQPMGLAVTSTSRANNLKDLLRLAKAEPGKLTISSPGVGSQNHLHIALLEQTTGTTLLHVPYRGGGPQVQALMGGEHEAGVVSLSTIIPAVQSGRVRLLATFSSTRSDMFPNVPTLAEEGVKDFDITAWVGVFLPIGTPPAVVSTLSAEIGKALQREDVRKALSASALEPLPMSPSEFARRVSLDYAKYGKIIDTTSEQLKER